MTASAVAIGARLKGCARTEPRGAGLRAQGSTAVVWPLLLSDTAAELAVTWCAAELSRPSHSGETASGQHNNVVALRRRSRHSQPGEEAQEVVPANQNKMSS